MSSCETFNCILSPHERCIRGDNNNNKNNSNNNKNNINVRNIHVAFKKNLNVFVGDSLDNCSVSGDDSTKAIPECSSSKSSVSDHRLSKTEESQHEVPSSSSLGSYPDPNFSNPGQPDKNSSKNETMVASSLVQIWEARTTQQPPSSNQNQSQIDSRTSSSGSNVLENSESLNEESELIQRIEEGNNEEEKEEMESDTQFVPDCGEKERESVRVMDIIRKLSNDSETTANNDAGSGSWDNGKEVQTTEAKSFPQVACSPRIRGRQAFADLLVQMIRDREKELACLSDRHSVSKFTQRGRIQSTLRIRSYQRCIAIQDRHRSKSSGAGSDINRSSRGSGVRHLLREKYKTNSENIETVGTPSSSVSSRGRIMDKASEKKVVEETMEKIDVKEVQKAVLSQIVENKNGLKKSKKENAERMGEKGETREKPNARESLEERGEKPELTKETAKKAVLSKGADDKSGFKKPAGETIQKETKEKAIAKENCLVGIAEKVNLWNSEEKMNRRRWMEKGKTDQSKDDVLESAERSINTSRETMPSTEFAEKVVKEDCVSVETKSKEIGEEEKVLQENGVKKPTEKESVEGNTLMGIAEKVNLWNSKEKKNRRRVMEKGKGKTHGKANEASRRIINVETVETSIATSKETVIGTQEMKDQTMQCESEEMGRRKKEEEFSSLGVMSKDITEVNSQQVLPGQESEGHGSIERAKEIRSGEEMFILQNPEAKSTKAIDRNYSQENRIEEESAGDGSKETGKEKNEEMSTMRNPDDVNAIKESEFVNDWYEDDYGDYDHYNGEYSTDWIYDISRPRSYWEELRKERYLEVLNTESDNKDICHLIQSRTVSNFLTSDLRQNIDNLMTNLVHSHLGVPINQEKAKEEEEWTEECSARNQENNETEEEPEKTNFETASDGCSRSSARSSPLMMSWSFRDQDIYKDPEPETPVSLPEPSVPTNQSTQEMQMISDLRGQMEQIQREMLELRNTVKSCVDMQLHFQKSVVAQDLSRSGSSAEQRVDNKNPLKRKCCVCSEMPVDSLLYRCGHMCTCLKCAHELQWSSKKCPICMAPIVDVVRAFLDA